MACTSGFDSASSADERDAEEFCMMLDPAEENVNSVMRRGASENCTDQSRAPIRIVALFEAAVTVTAGKNAEDAED